jgi:threonylcarbamoyladenosine tRNA methylthiotransferase MtaB
MKIAIRTIGCRANQADSAELARALDRRVTAVVDELAEAELIVINTCCVTAEAERDCRKTARRALREAPGARVVLTGCAVTAVPAIGEQIDGEVELVGGGDWEPAGLARWINGLAVGQGDGPLTTAAGRRGRTRALLKVQHGCSHGCAYCVVPRARGPERSTPRAQLLEEVEQRAADGYRELVLTGVQLGAWGVDLPGRPRLAQLLVAVADRFAPGRLRLSSIEPWSVDDDLIEAVAGHDRICPHLHVPLQSGSDRILTAMGRGYRATEFRELAHRAARRIDDLAFGTDVLAGFPGEDEADFGATLELLEQVAPSYLHAFPFSPRPGTRAADLEQRPTREVARQRVRRVRELGARAANRFRGAQVGREHEVIVEQVDGATARGLTGNYLTVELPGAGLRGGELIRARVTGVGDGERLRVERC